MHNKQTMFNKEFQEACTQAEAIYAELEENEYQQLKQVCPRLQQTNHVNQAIQICLTCTATYCLPKPNITGEITNV